MEKNTVMLDLAKYNELYEAANRFQLIKAVVAEDKNEFGYSERTSSIIDSLLGVSRVSLKSEE